MNNTKQRFLLNAKSIVNGGFLLGLIAVASAMTSGCIVEPRDGYYREGYYDHDHHRYYHEHAWHECIEHDEHCR
jgi:hypothetical protein